MLIYEPLQANPISTSKSSLLGIPAASDQQILKYIVDFSDPPNAGFFSYTINPNGQTSFGCARMVRIDARNLLSSATFSISDTLSDTITIAPGDYETYHLDGLPGDTFTVYNNGVGSGKWGYLKLYFYNYLDISSFIKRRKCSYQTKITLGIAGSNVIFSYAAPGMGMPIIEQIDAYIEFGNATNGFGLVKLSPVIAPLQGYVGPTSWDFLWASGFVLVQGTTPNMLLPPKNIAVTPANDMTPAAYSWELDTVMTGAPQAGQGTMLIRYRFN